MRAREFWRRFLSPVRDDEEPTPVELWAFLLVTLAGMVGICWLFLRALC